MADKKRVDILIKHPVSRKKAKAVATAGTAAGAAVGVSAGMKIQKIR